MMPGIPELVESIFHRLEVEPSHGLNFEGTPRLSVPSTECIDHQSDLARLTGVFVWRGIAEFCVTVKSQPLLLECFSQQALDARAREDEASAERAIALHGLENFESKMMAAISDGKKAKWKE